VDGLNDFDPGLAPPQYRYVSIVVIHENVISVEGAHNEYPQLGVGEHL
jgi:hypothetical protein